jgi:DNA processing protein
MPAKDNNVLISANTQAILLLTAPLITGHNGNAKGELLTQAEYQRLARRLWDLKHEPADLLEVNADDLLQKVEMVVAIDRMRQLLGRGFQLSQAIERWHSRAIWVVSRADQEYPRKIKNRLKEDSPAVLYGCGEPGLLDSGGLAIIGSRHVEQALIEYTEDVGQQCAVARKSVISGGAQGIDRAGMRGALEAGGQTIGVLAENLERAALNRENRNWLLEEKLVLVSAYDPGAGFNVGHAMQRNKLIYALADAALVVNAEFEKGGTWAGATEQLQKLRFVPVYVRSTGEIGQGLEALTRMGAQPWPNPAHPHELLNIFERAESTPVDKEPQLAFSHAGSTAREKETPISVQHSASDDSTAQQADLQGSPEPVILPGAAESPPHRVPAEILKECLRDILADLLVLPKSESEVASALQVSKAQVRLWLKEFVEEGLLKKLTKPVKFIIKPKRLL